MLRLLHPEFALWLLAIPLAFACWTVAKYLSVTFWRSAPLSKRQAALSRVSKGTRDVVRLVAALLAVGALGFAVMRPQVYRAWQTPQYEQRDLVICLDRSVSMQAQDLRPNRFTRAVTEIRNFLREKPDGIDRVGLVGFAGASIILSYLTRDVNSLHFYLDFIQEDPRPMFGSDFGAALESAREVIKRDDKQTTKMVLVVSDGDEQGGTLVKSIGQLRDDGVRVYTIGVGSDSAVPIPIMVEGRPDTLKDEQGKAVTTTFTENTLRTIAAQTGGRYYRSITGTELSVAMHDMARRERRIVGSATTVEYRDIHPWVLLVAALATTLLVLTS